MGSRVQRRRRGWGPQRIGAKLLYTWRTSKAERGHGPSGAPPTTAPGLSRGWTAGVLYSDRKQSAGNPAARSNDPDARTGPVCDENIL